jgi:hypothetical protein
VDVPVFPFSLNPIALPIFCGATVCPNWTGFFAPIAGTVPSYAPVALCFRVTFTSPAVSLDNLVRYLTPEVGVVTTDSLGLARGTPYRVLPTVRPAEILDYRFDRGAGRTAINYAGIVGGAPPQGQLLGTAPWTAGRFGSALAAGHTCDTGWTGDLGGSFSIGWFMRGSAPAVETPIFRLGVPPPQPRFRCFTGGVAGTGIRCTLTIGGAVGVINLTTDIHTLAAAGWVHVALVVDNNVLPATATWYVDGVAQPPLTLAGRPSIDPSTSSLQIGAMASPYAIDEFRMVAEPVSAAVVGIWANGSPAKTTNYSYAGTCGANLRAIGLPTLGNSGFKLRTEGAPGSPCSVTLGATPYLLGITLLPIDLGLVNSSLSGCLWYSDLAISLPVFLPANGLGDLTVPIPNDMALQGLDLDAQTLVLEPPMLTLRATNPLVLAIN